MTFPAARRAALSSLALVFSSPLALAQSAAEPALAAVLVTASRAPQAAADVLSDHVLISSEDIERSGAISVIDLLRKQRGIEVTRNGGPGANASVFIRGADSKQSVVLVDGVRIGASTTGAANWSALPLANVARIEIIYGPLATMYGADAIGGVVQIFTRRGAGAARVTAAAGVGSQKARQLEAAVAGASGGEHAISYALAAARAQDEGRSATLPGLSSYNADKDGYQRESASGQFAMTLARGHEAGLLFLHSRLSGQYDSGASSFDTRSVQKLNNAALFSRHQITRDWRIGVQAARADDQAATFTGTAASGTSRIETRQHAYSVQSDTAFGADLLQLVAERRVEDVVSGSSAALTRGRSTTSLAASYSLTRGDHLALASARRDDSSQYGVKSTGGLAYGYRISGALRASASVGTSFRAPTFNELYFPGFGVTSNKPEQGKNAEAGLSYRGGRSEVSAVYYHNRMSGLLVHSAPCPVQVSTHPSGCAYNINKATLSGLSVGARTRIWGLDLNGALDLQDPRDDTTGKSLHRRARRHAKLAADYSVGNFEVGARLQLSGKRFDDAANRNTLGGYGLLDLSASYRFAPDWSALVRWNNVTDKRYELARKYASAGSQVFAGVRYGIR